MPEASKFDLFISYASYDRPWAERLYIDLERSFPTIRIFWDRDPHAIPPGTDWSAALKQHAQTAKHFALLWTEKAKDSNEVGPEYQAFAQNVQTNPTSDGATRQTFYIPLEGQYGPLELIQGFPELRRQKAYAADAPDRGISRLASGAERDEWRRTVRIIGDKVLASESTQPINLALLVMNRATRDLVDPFLNVRTGPEPTLQEFLSAANLDLTVVKQRYGDNAFGWQPYGPGRTVVDLMEELRVTVNRNLPDEYRFHWVPSDLMETALQAQDEIAFRQSLDRLAAAPSAVVVDAFSLFNPIVLKLFVKLGDYAKKEHAIIVSLAPNEAPTAELLYQCLRANGTPILDAYFRPQIPATGTFARCRVNVEHVSDIERLIRAGLGAYYLGRRKAEGKSLTALGTSAS